MREEKTILLRKNGLENNKNIFNCPVSRDCTIRKEMKCSGDSDILHELICDATYMKSEKHELIRVVYHAPIREVSRNLRYT